MKYQVSYSRKIATVQYESLSIMQSMDFQDREIGVEEAYLLCRDDVNRRLEEELKRMGLWRGSKL